MRIKGTVPNMHDSATLYWFLLYPLEVNLQIEYPNSNQFRDIYSQRINNCIFEINPHYPYWTKVWKKYSVFCATREMGLFSLNPMLPLEKIKILGANLYLNKYLKGKNVIRFHQYENKSYEKEMMRICRNNNIATVGYINGIPGQLETLVSNDDSQPDLLMSSSRYVTDYIRQLGYNGNISNTYNIRQKFSHYSRYENAACTTLVLFPIYTKITKKLYEFTLQLASDSESNFIIKFHPFGRNIDGCKFDNIKIASDLNSAFVEADRVLFMGETTVALEALCNGLPLIKYCPTDFPTVADGIHGKLRKYVSEITSTDDFKRIIGSLKLLPENDVNQLRNYIFNADINKDDFWLKIDEFERGITNE